MTSVAKDTTIGQYKQFVRDVYGLPNERHFSVNDMLTNVGRFVMRGLKGIRKQDYEKTKFNLLIAFSWFVSLTNNLHIDLENAVWNRFPYMCSYCASQPCVCKEKKISTRQKVNIKNEKKPETIEDFQKMFEEIYPSQSRTVEHSAVHLAEEFGELSEAIMAYRGEHKDELFENVVFETADVFSCFMGVFNSINVNLADALSKMFNDNCHVCHKAPCNCNFSSVVKFKS